MAEGLATHVLSAPLTVAKATNQQKWCCIGARAEASLPVQYWREVLVVLSWLNHANAPVQVQLDFIGPEVLQRPPLTLSYMDATLKLQWTFSGKFHEMDPAHASSYDAYILLNPGLGHDHLMVDWKPSIDLLLGCSAPKLLTAHSKLDASRDAKVLSDYFLASSLDYELNPFASRITYQDPFDSSHMVQPNHYVLQLSDENIK
ncbi:hypothetical protein MPSEU_000013700 [Mayamaea pseudoterrestris]|nr:hypothetical protein MPSEU_000013700 [Mayamaea pseudoterrestris]